ncbi:hypothetical protein QBC38DRAFT_464705 [Podospora fimiseda]|uniref:FAD-binding domain-containing protein n=1 Tax=Podospora fimiseda TaxID=252190 RepID=A0AAN7BY88_9PEZI|nr:hypothetical protein QBC38DRAFT_464705 [Podospora fimiseda]
MAISNHFLEGKKIIVVGGGISGCTFVAALRKLWNPSLTPPEIAVFDRNPKNETNTYSMAIHGDSVNGGLVALQQLGVLDDALKHSTFGLKSGEFKMWDANWNELMSTKATPWGNLPTGSIRISRRDLQRILINEAEKGDAMFHWEADCTAVEHMSDGRVRVTVDQGNGVTSAHDCDLLIVADGARSKIRAALRPGDDLKFAGAVQMGGKAHFPRGIPHPVGHNWGIMLSGQGICCYFSAIDQETVVWALSQQKPEPETQPSFPALKQEALRIGHMFAEPFRTIVQSTDPSTGFILAAKDKQPFRHNDEHLRGIVFIGDANHAVSPFAGNGGNLALKDGWDLAENLCRSTTLRDAVSAYDRLGFARAADALKQSHTRIDFAHCMSIKDSLFRAGLATGRWLMRLKGVTGA